MAVGVGTTPPWYTPSGTNTSSPPAGVEVTARFVVHGKWGRAAAEAFALEDEDPEYPDLIPRDRKRKVRKLDGVQREGSRRDYSAEGRA